VRTLLSAAILVLAQVVLAQAPSVPEPAAALQAELKKLAAASDALLHDLPSITCKETALSQEIKKKKVKAQVRFAADLRVQRDEDGVTHEELNFTEANGKPTANRPPLPVMVLGGFDRGLLFFAEVNQRCFNYTLAGDRIDFESLADPASREACQIIGDPKGFALLDAAGNVVHLERQVSVELSRQLHLAYFSTIDFATTELGGKSYSLATNSSSDIPRDDEILHFEAAYTSCRLFKARSTILPDFNPVPEQVPHR